MSFKVCMETQWPVGPATIPLAIIGEAPGEEEEQAGLPFVGPSGQVINSWLRQKEIERDRLMITNVFWSRPKKNDVSRYFVRNNDELAYKNDSVPRYKNKRVLSELTPQLRQLREQIKSFQPKVILAVGTIAMWATTGRSEKITEVMGQKMEGQFIGKGFTIVPVLHPSYLLRLGSTHYVKECLDAVEVAKRLAL